MKKQFTFAIIGMALLLGACSTPYKHLERGQYKLAIDQAIRKVQGKKKKKTKYVQSLEEAFEKVVSIEMRRANALTDEGRPEDLETIHEIYKGIDYLQDRVRPLLPLYSKDGYEAQFKFVRVEPLVVESRNKAVEFLYKEGSRALTLAENGDKQKAREAYAYFDRTEDYISNYQNARELKNMALDLGQTHVFLRMLNNSNTLIPQDLEEEILYLSLEQLRKDKWIRYHTSEPDILTDYLVIFNVQNIDVSPEAIREKIYALEEEVEDGWSYILDENGNVAKDSLGNDIKEPNFIKVRADVIETQQLKTASIKGRLDFIDNKNGNRIKSEDIRAENVFENFFSICQGDPRAVDTDRKKYLNDEFIPFPSDEQMVYDGFNVVKPELINYLRRHKDVFRI